MRHAYSKCLGRLVRKSKQLKTILQEAEIHSFKNVQLQNENKSLNEKIESVCFRFLRLMDRRSEEVGKKLKILETN